MRVFLIFCVTFISVMGLPIAGMVYKAKYGPREVVVYKDRIAWREPGGDCMQRNEMGVVKAVGITNYSEPTKENPKATFDSTSVTFQMPNNSTRICKWDYMDLTNNLKEGMVFTAKDGKRIM